MIHLNTYERQLDHGARLMDFAVQARERIDSIQLPAASPATVPAQSLRGGCSNDSDYDDAEDNVAGDDDDDDDDDDDHEEEEAELALGQRWDWLQLADFVLNVAQVDRGQGGRNGRLWHETPFRFHILRSSDRSSSYCAV